MEGKTLALFALLILSFSIGEMLETDTTFRIVIFVPCADYIFGTPYLCFTWDLVAV
jgi:hypothetical protein